MPSALAALSVNDIKPSLWQRLTPSKIKTLKMSIEILNWMGGVYFCQNCIWMDHVPAKPRKLNFLYTNFLPDPPPISIPFLREKHWILPKLGVFYNNLLKIHPFFFKLLYQILWKIASKGRYIYVYHVNVRPPRIESWNLHSMTIFNFVIYAWTVIILITWFKSQVQKVKF